MFRRSQEQDVAGGANSLVAAAGRALEIARRERLPLAHIAERESKDDPQFWFAGSILRIVAVEGRRPEKSGRETLPKGALDGLELDPGMTALRAPGTGEQRYVDLLVPPGEFAKFIKWARSVQ